MIPGAAWNLFRPLFVRSLSQLTVVIRAGYSSVSETSEQPVSQEVCLDRSSDDGIARLCLNRPSAKNALGANLIEQFQSTMEELHGDSTTRCVVLYSKVPKVFCAGADLKERISMSTEEVGPLVATARQMFQSLASLPMPTICAMDGIAMGGGLEMALACDVRIASRSARMGLVETSLAILPGAGGTQRLPRLVGVSKAKELIFRAEMVPADEAHAIGLVNAVVDDNAECDSAYRLAMEWASAIARNGPLAIRWCKLAIDSGVEAGGSLTEALEIEENFYAQVVPTKDRMEGLLAFKEKRQPVYKGE